jgi:hypothetical protein
LTAPTKKKAARSEKRHKRGGFRRGAGRPQIKAGRVIVKIRIDPKVLAGFDAIAEKNRTDRSRVIEEGILEWFKVNGQEDKM